MTAVQHVGIPILLTIAGTSSSKIKLSLLWHVLAQIIVMIHYDHGTPSQDSQRVRSVADTGIVEQPYTPYSCKYA